MRVHWHNNFTRRHDEFHKRIFRFHGENLHHFVADHISQGRAFDLYTNELLHRRKPD